MTRPYNRYDRELGFRLSLSAHRLHRFFELGATEEVPVYVVMTEMAILADRLREFEASLTPEQASDLADIRARRAQEAQEPPEELDRPADEEFCNACGQYHVPGDCDLAEYLLIVLYEDGSTKQWPITWDEVSENRSKGGDTDWDAIYGERNPSQYGEVKTFWGEGTNNRKDN